MAQTYYSPVTVQTGQVPSTQTDFPMLVSYTDNRLKTTGNGGHVANSNGYDIRPYSDSALTSTLTFELEYYNASTGQVVLWVKIASLADASVVYLGYGDASLNTDGSSSSTWTSQYKAVYHFRDGTTLSLTDSTSNGNNGTNHSFTASAGQIDGATNNGGSAANYIDTGNTTYLTTDKPTSISAWIKTAGSGTRVIWGQNTGGGPIGFGVNNNGTLYLNKDQQAGIGNSSGTVSNGSWAYVVVTYDSSGNFVFYINGSVGGSGTNNQTFSNSGSQTATIGVDIVNSAGWNGDLDEIRKTNTATTANQVTTEYNNQFAPTTFAVLGTEVPVGGGTANYFIIAFV